MELSSVRILFDLETKNGHVLLSMRMKILELFKSQQLIVEWRHYFLEYYSEKKDFNSDWCYLYDLNKSCWQLKGHDIGCPWTIEKLCEQAEKVSEGNLTVTNCKGVRDKPYFKIPIARVIWPIKKL